MGVAIDKGCEWGGLGLRRRLGNDLDEGIEGCVLSLSAVCRPRGNTRCRY